MMPLAVTPFYAGLLAFFYVFLSAQVIRQRYASRISIGDGKDTAMLRKMRVHSNFAEYAPFGLILIGFLELSGGAWWQLHVLGIGLVIGRLTHAYGLSQEPDNFQLRRIGMICTFTVLILAGAANMISAFQNGLTG